MSKFDTMNEALRPARNEEGYPITQSDYDALRQRVAELERKVQLYESITTGYEHERVEAVLRGEAHVD